MYWINVGFSWSTQIHAVNEIKTCSTYHNNHNQHRHAKLNYGVRITQTSSMMCWGACVHQSKMTAWFKNITMIWLYYFCNRIFILWLDSFVTWVLNKNGSPFCGPIVEHLFWNDLVENILEELLASLMYFHDEE